MSTDSSVTATSEVGIDGIVVIDAPVEEIVGELAQLSTQFFDASAELEEACLARDAPAGTFAVQRTRSLPPPDAIYTPEDDSSRIDDADPEADVCEEP
jgi:hypothetical protein